MSLARVQKTGQQSSSSVASLATSFPSSTTTGDLLVIGVALNTGTVSTVTDNYSNTWVLAKAAAFTGDVEIWYCLNAAGGAGHQVTVTPSTSAFVSVGMAEYQPGVAGTATLGGSSSGTGASTSPSSGNVTPTGTPLIFGAMTDNSGSASITEEASWSDVFTGLTSTDRTISVEDFIGAAGTYAATWTIGSSVNWAAVAAWFTASDAPLVNKPATVTPAIARPRSPGYVQVMAGAQPPDLLNAFRVVAPEAAVAFGMGWGSAVVAHGPPPIPPPVPPPVLASQEPKRPEDGRVAAAAGFTLPPPPPPHPALATREPPRPEDGRAYAAAGFRPTPLPVPTPPPVLASQEPRRPEDGRAWAARGTLLPLPPRPMTASQEPRRPEDGRAHAGRGFTLPPPPPRPAVVWWENRRLDNGSAFGGGAVIGGGGGGDGGAVAGGGVGPSQPQQNPPPPPPLVPVLPCPYRPGRPDMADGLRTRTDAADSRPGRPDAADQLRVRPDQCR